MLKFQKLVCSSKFLTLAAGLVMCGTSIALPTCLTNYSVSNATLSDGGILNGTWTVDWAQSTPALTAANLTVTGGTAGYGSDAFVVPGTVNNPLAPINSSSPGTFYAANIKASANTHNIWLMFNVDTGVLQHNFGPTYVSLNNASLSVVFNTATDVGSSTATPQCAAPAAIPTLGEWAMIFMASLMAMFGIRRMRRTK